MKYFGFLSFGHYSNGGRHGITAAESLHQAIDLSVAADELGVNGAFFRVHHFAPQAAAPMPLLSAIASRTKAIEVGTGVIDAAACGAKWWTRKKAPESPRLPDPKCP